MSARWGHLGPERALGVGERAELVAVPAPATRGGRWRVSSSLSAALPPGGRRLRAAHAARALPRSCQAPAAASASTSGAGRGERISNAPRGLRHPGAVRIDGLGGCAEPARTALARAPRTGAPACVDEDSAPRRAVRGGCEAPSPAAPSAGDCPGRSRRRPAPPRSAGAPRHRPRRRPRPPPRGRARPRRRGRPRPEAAQRSRTRARATPPQSSMRPANTSPRAPATTSARAASVHPRERPLDECARERRRHPGKLARARAMECERTPAPRPPRVPRAPRRPSATRGTSPALRAPRPPRADTPRPSGQRHLGRGPPRTPRAPPRRAARDAPPVTVHRASVAASSASSVAGETSGSARSTSSVARRAASRRPRVVVGARLSRARLALRAHHGHHRPRPRLRG